MVVACRFLAAGQRDLDRRNRSLALDPAETPRLGSDDPSDPFEGMLEALPSPARPNRSDTLNERRRTLSGGNRTTLRKSVPP
jgi:hypothetical protein